MIAADTSALSAFLKGDIGPDIDRVADALRSGNLFLPPVVVTELLSDPLASKTISEFVSDIERLPLLDGYWERAGHNRQLLKKRGLKCKIADTLIAQSCIDSAVALIACDGDFRHFEKHCGLKLA